MRPRVPALVLLTISAASCGDTPPTETENAARTLNTTGARSEIIEDGRIYRWIGRIDPPPARGTDITDPIQEIVYRDGTKPRPRVVDTPESIADGLRAYKIVPSGDVYLSDGDVEWARRSIARKNIPEMVLGVAPETEGGASVQYPLSFHDDERPQELWGIFGTDDRRTVNWTKIHERPLRSQSLVQLVDKTGAGAVCTASFIGRTTAISAAHCFYAYDLASFRTFLSITPGVSAGVLSSGGPYTCWRDIKIPKGYVDTREVRYDFAVMDFYGCSPTPTHLSGSEGWWSNAWGSSGYRSGTIGTWGYPKFCPGMDTDPWLCGMMGTAYYQYDPCPNGCCSCGQIGDPYEIKTTQIDVSGGQSGAGAMFQSSGWWFAIGVLASTQGEWWPTSGWTYWNDYAYLDWRFRDFIRAYSVEF